MPTVEEILAGTRTGRRQSVGNMDVIPLLGEDDDTFAPPDFSVGNTTYGQVNVRNGADRPSIVPPGAGWVVNALVQDHAVCGGKMVPAKKTTSINGACCIQQTQGGLIRDHQDKTMVILPAQLRTEALAIRRDTDYSRLWGPISKFKSSNGLRGPGNLIDYLSAYEKELDQFVAEFERVPNQVGAVVMIDGKVVGIERAPSSTFWDSLWEPLIRVCYGSYSLYRAKKKVTEPRRTKLTKVKTFEQLVEAVEKAEAKDESVTVKTMDALLKENLLFGSAPGSGDRMRLRDKQYELTTLANPRYAGQAVQTEGRTLYASITVAKP